MTDSPTPPATPTLGRTIIRNTAFVTLGRILLKVFGFLFGVFVVRQLGDDQYGRYSIVIAWVGLFSIFVELGITQYITREMARGSQGIGSMFWNLFAVRLALAGVGLFVIPAGAALAGYDGDITLGVAVYATTFIVAALQAPLDAVLVAREAFGWLTAAAIVGQIAWLVLGAGVMWLQPSFLWLIGVGLFAMLPQLAFSGWIVARYKLIDWTIRIEPATWPRLIRAGLPFGVISLALTIAFSIDTVMLSWFVSNAEVGWYNVAYGLVRSFVSLLSGFSVAMVPTLARVFATDGAAVSRWHARSVRLIALIAVPVAIGGMLVAGPLVRFLYTPDVYPAAGALAIIVWDVPLLMYAAVCGNVTTIIGEERAAARINVINAIANVALNVICIPLYGMLGAALVTVATDAIASVQFTLLLNRRLNAPIPVGTFVRVGLATAGLGAAVWAAGEQHVLVLIAIGAGVYGVLAIVVGAVGPDEWALVRRLTGAVQRRVFRPR